MIQIFGYAAHPERVSKRKMYEFLGHTYSPRMTSVYHAMVAQHVMVDPNGAAFEILGMQPPKNVYYTENEFRILVISKFRVKTYDRIKRLDDLREEFGVKLESFDDYDRLLVVERLAAE